MTEAIRCVSADKSARIPAGNRLATAAGARGARQVTVRTSDVLSYCVAQVAIANVKVMLTFRSSRRRIAAALGIACLGLTAAACSSSSSSSSSSAASTPRVNRRVVSGRVVRRLPVVLGHRLWLGRRAVRGLARQPDHEAGRPGLPDRERLLGDRRGSGLHRAGDRHQGQGLQGRRVHQRQPEGDRDPDGRRQRQLGLLLRQLRLVQRGARLQPEQQVRRRPSSPSRGTRRSPRPGSSSASPTRRPTPRASWSRRR